ncbi:MAG: hypothetical protein KDA90_03120 [Planctomycetaceae bacterium]|nr:hypothetical protein [Planctomycetaceae bacterium]
MRLIIEPIWSWPTVVVTGLVLVGIVLWTYPSRLRPLSPLWRRTLLSLRLLTALILLFAMLRPAVEITEEDHEASKILILTDTSRSMGTPDMPGGLTRRAALLKTLVDHEDALQRLKDAVDIEFFDFADELLPVVTPEATADGPFTAIGKLLQTLREEETGQRVVGAFLLSDGAQRAGGEDEIDPRSEARRFAEQSGVPINTVVYGTSELSSAGLDLAVEDLSLDQPVTFERKTVPVRAKVRLLGAAGRKVRVRLLLEDRTGKGLGEAGELKPLPLSQDARPFRDIETRENAEEIPVELSFVASQAGEFKVAIEVVPLEGEVKTLNNRLETLITVRKGGLKVAYFDVYRPEQRFLRRLNDTAKIQLDFQLVLSGEFGKQTTIDPRLFEQGAYDAYIIGDVPASVFQNGNRSLLVELERRVNEGAGLAMIGGLHNFGAGGYASSPLAKLLPVKMSPADSIGLTDPAVPGQHFSQKLQVLPTPDGERHYLMRLSSSGNDKTWRALPKVGGANRLAPRSGAVDVLAESEDGAPLLMVADTGRGRTLAFAVDETWKWYLHGYSAEHQRFWQQLILWLARKEFETEGQVWARVEPRNFPPLSRIPIEVGSRDESGNPITDASYQLEVITPGDGAKPLVTQRVGDHALGEFADTLEPGDYWARVQATRSGESLGLPAMARFIINARDIELDNPTADPDLMREIAEITGGVAVAPEDFGTFIDKLLEAGINTEMLRHRRINLWDHWLLLTLFVLLMSTEWTIRKLKGLV